MVDFHATSQRLAVGTADGAVVMYDLKTATLLYVLGAHRQRPAGCSFSPDGRQLVTVSIEESVALVWKVGSSLSRRSSLSSLLFNPRIAPSGPFIGLEFEVGTDHGAYAFIARGE